MDKHEPDQRIDPHYLGLHWKRFREEVVEKLEEILDSEGDNRGIPQ